MAFGTIGGASENNPKWLVFNLETAEFLEVDPTRVISAGTGSHGAPVTIPEEWLPGCTN